MKTLKSILFLPAVALLFSTLPLAGENEEKLFDEYLAKNATAVLRVHRFQTWGMLNSPFIRYYVQVYKVFKNESNENLNRRVGSDLGVHAFKGKDGVPEGECTIYIGRYDVPNQRFDETNGTIWMLIGGDATNGVSHVDSNAKFR